MPSRVQLCLALALLLPAHLLVGAQQKQPTISEDEIKRYFEKSSGCDNVDIDSLQYFDFTGKGDEDAVVVAGSRSVTRGKGKDWGISLFTPVIVKYRDSKTDARVQLEDWLR